MRNNLPLTSINHAEGKDETTNAMVAQLDSRAMSALSHPNAISVDRARGPHVFQPQAFTNEHAQNSVSIYQRRVYSLTPLLASLAPLSMTGNSVICRYLSSETPS